MNSIVGYHNSQISWWGGKFQGMLRPKKKFSYVIPLVCNTLACDPRPGFSPVNWHSKSLKRLKSDAPYDEVRCSMHTTFNFLIIGESDFAAFWFALCARCCRCVSPTWISLFHSTIAGHHAWSLQDTGQPGFPWNKGSHFPSKKLPFAVKTRVWGR